MTQTEKQKMMLTAPVEGLICRMAVPTIISMLITALYNMADTYFVGKLGSNAATGAVGVALPLMAIIQAMGFFFGHGSGNSISRHLGAGDVEDAEKLAACGFAGAIGTGLIICVLGQLVSFVILLWALRRAGCVPLRFRYVRCMPSVIGQIFGGGLPSLVRQGLFFIPAVILLPLPLGLLGVQISQSISDLLAFSLAVYMYKKYEPRMWEMYKV